MTGREKIKLTPLGGVGEVGRNCFLYEYGNYILVIDCGIMPHSSEEREGLKSGQIGDSAWRSPHYPKLEILEKKIKEGKKVQALITHGHLDHVGAISKLIALGIPIRISSWTRRFFTNRYIDSYISEEEIGRANFLTLPQGKSEFQFGDFLVKCFPVNHSIPSAFGILIKVGGEEHSPYN